MRDYKRKRPRQWRDKDKRMCAAVRLRAEGMSLRQIGRELAVSEITVRRDLARWAAERPNVIPLRHPAATSHPTGGNMSHSDVAPKALVSVIGRRNA
jgi:hypothetical protein